MVFGVFSPGRTQCIAPKKLPDKAMSIWNLHKKFQLSSAMGLRDFDLQSQPTLMGGEPINCRALHTSTICPIELKMDFLGHLLMYLPENFSTFA